MLGLLGLVALWNALVYPPLMNALCVVGAGLLVLVLARLLLPGRPLARWAALAFFVCSPVVLKTAAMFHPQPLAMLL